MENNKPFEQLTDELRVAVIREHKELLKTNIKKLEKDIESLIETFHGLYPDLNITSLGEKGWVQISDSVRLTLFDVKITVEFLS